jgi:hypothetical protein
MCESALRGHTSRAIDFYYHHKKTDIIEHKNLLSAATDCFYLQNICVCVLLTTLKNRNFLESIIILKSFRNVCCAYKINVLLDSIFST